MAGEGRQIDGFFGVFLGVRGGSALNFRVCGGREKYRFFFFFFFLCVKENIGFCEL